jgi:hypothetical protein
MRVMSGSPWCRHRSEAHGRRGGDAPPAAWCRFSGDRKGQHPKDHLARFRGWMHADGYAGFEDLYRSGAIREVACMALAIVLGPIVEV